jgi:hypothetical protein
MVPRRCDGYILLLAELYVSRVRFEDNIMQSATIATEIIHMSTKMIL